MAPSKILIASGGELDVASTLQSGQCFRWSRNADGSFSGIVEGFPAIVTQERDDVYIQTNNGDADFWRNYFDIDTDYTKITQKLSKHPFVREAVKTWKGLRVLRQFPWETLCSYLISQRNNIPRISGTIAKLCENFGSEIIFNGRRFHSFPKPEVFASLEPNYLRPFGLGYRDKYIVSVARSVANGDVDFEMLRLLPTDLGRKKLLTLYGVGKKVADCFLLYGLGKYDAFPVDTWISRASKVHGFDVTEFGEHAGIAQLYIFQHFRFLR